MSLQQLLEQPGIWRGRGGAPRRGRGLPTGWEVLDRQLPGGGWPRGAVTEILVDGPGAGALSLLLPGLRRLLREGRRVLCVSPPLLLYAPALERQGLDLARLAVIDAPPADALWCAEQALRSGACGAVVCWPGACDDRALRRLQLAAERGRCHAFLFRSAAAAAAPSPAALRVRLWPAGRLELLKCRGALTGPRELLLETGQGR